MYGYGTSTVVVCFFAIYGQYPDSINMIARTILLSNGAGYIMLQGWSGGDQCTTQILSVPADTVSRSANPGFDSDDLFLRTISLPPDLEASYHRLSFGS